MLVPARFPMGCCTYFNLTQVTTYHRDPLSTYLKQNETYQLTCAFLSDHQLRGITRMLGIAASAAGAPERMSEDWTHRAGIERARDD